MDARAGLCKLLCELCVVVIPCGSDSFVLHTDAWFGIGCVSMKMSRGLWLSSLTSRDRDTRYSASELECLAVVEVVCSLFDRSKVPAMDQSQSPGGFIPHNKLVNQYLAGWVLFLQKIDFIIRY